MRHQKMVRGIVLLLAVIMVASLLVGALYPLFF